MYEAFHIVLASLGLVIGLIAALLVRGGLRFGGGLARSIISGWVAGVLAIAVVVDIWTGDVTQSSVTRVIYVLALIIWCWAMWPRDPRKRKRRLKEAGAKAKALLAKLVESIKPVRAPLPNPA